MVWRWPARSVDLLGVALRRRISALREMDMSDPELDPDDLASCADQCCAECGEPCDDDAEFCDACLDGMEEDEAEE